MANIDTYLQQILAAIYGEDVRGSIHDAIEAINDQVDAAEETMEQFVQGAMDTTLTSTTKPAEGKAVGDAIDDLKSALEQTASLTGVKWYNGYYDNNNSFVSNQYYKMSNIIPCMAGDTFIYHGISSQTNRKVVLFYNKDGDIISSMTNIGPDYTEIMITVPDNAEYMRVLAKTEDLHKTYIIYGGTAVQHPLYENRKRIVILKDEVDDLKVDLTEIQSLVGVEWYDGYYGIDGSFTDTPYWKTSNAIPVKAGDTFVYCGNSSQQNRRVISYFDRNAVALSYVSNFGTDYTPQTLTVPSGAEYMRVLGYTEKLNQVYIKYGVNASQNILRENREKIIANQDNISALQKNNTICYVDPDASSGGNGTASAPYASIVDAVTAGHRKIKAKAGLYNAEQQIRVESGEFDLSLWSDKRTFDTSIPDREKIVLFKGDVLTWTASGNNIVADYTPRTDRRFQKVFIDKTLSPIDSSFTLATAYNVCLFLWKAGHKARRYEPVLYEDFTGAEGTFTYNNGSVIVRRFSTDMDSDLKIYISDDPGSVLYFVEDNCLRLSDTVVLGAWFGGAYIFGCQNVDVVDCDFICTSHGDGIEATDSNINLQNCLASGCAQDGYGFQHYGESKVINSSAYYCGDDGMSHHRGCVGYVDGGEYSYNGSGGITPAFGATVNISNTVTIGNENGLQFFGSNGFKSRDLTVMNCLSIENTNKDIYNDGYNITFVNCVYRQDKVQAVSPHTNTFYPTN